MGRNPNRRSRIGVRDTARGNPFAVFEIIADARKIRNEALNVDVRDYANRIEQHADGMVKTILDIDLRNIKEGKKAMNNDKDSNCPQLLALLEYSPVKSIRLFKGTPQSKLDDDSRPQKRLARKSLHPLKNDPIRAGLIITLIVIICLALAATFTGAVVIARTNSKIAASLLALFGATLRIVYSLIKLLMNLD